MTSCAHPARSKSIDLENCGVVFLLPRLLSFFPVPTPGFAVARFLRFHRILLRRCLPAACMHSRKAISAALIPLTRSPTLSGSNTSPQYPPFKIAVGHINRQALPEYRCPEDGFLQFRGRFGKLHQVALQNGLIQRQCARHQTQARSAHNLSVLAASPESDMVVKQKHSPVDELDLAKLPTDEPKIRPGQRRHGKPVFLSSHHSELIQAEKDRQASAPPAPSPPAWR
jgi:hypothetical protein